MSKDLTDYSCLLTDNWEKKIDQWLDEDVPSFDFGGFIVGNEIKIAALWAKQECTLSGSPFFTRIFEKLGCIVEFKFSDGDDITLPESGRCLVAEIRGPSNKLLLGERVALNLLARSSGIATRARYIRNLALSKGWGGIVAATRKTTPGFRLVEKYSLIVGGVDTHRYDLSSMIMIKDNHIASCGSIKLAIEKARKVGGLSLKIEVECQNIKEAQEAIENGADIIMLDNFNPTDLAVAAKKLKEKYGNKVKLEASGGIIPDTIENYFVEQVDIISMGSLVQGVPHIDFSLKLSK